ncbi:hypothetical protein [Brevibacillus sp. NRS-1366]|uniref:hypothetical protein n=1 Tax=Brevibacillus sp. NRS-1366 TaxID=3233899 RepID=UPI003D1FAF98
MLEPSYFAVSFAPKKLPVGPITGEREGISYTIQKMSEMTHPKTNEKIWSIEVEAVGQSSGFPRWILRDDLGKSYPVEIDYQNTWGEPGKIQERLFIKDLKALPGQLTLVLQAEKKAHADVDWRIPIPAP